MNRIKQFRNIPSRASGSVLEAPPDNKVTLRAQLCASTEVIRHFASEKCDFWPITLPFFHRRDQNNFHILGDLYQRSPLARFSEEGAFSC
ncbi:MAG: hypothetical protein DME32_16360 [Verrucomicrobia bacterium]|nr:MAG: hypothetical protein DME32_16360 [Verrucomicrobiota bacterium]